MRLDRIFCLNIFRSFFILCLIFLPILYLSDCFFAEDFVWLYSLAKLPMRYGQSIANLLLWGCWLGVKNVRKKYGDEVFVSMGFRIKDSWRVILIVSVVCMLFDGLVLIPSNQVLEPEVVVRTNWAIKDQDGSTIFIYNKESKELFDYRIVFNEIRSNFGDSMNLRAFAKNYFHNVGEFNKIVLKSDRMNEMNFDNTCQEFKNVEAYWVENNYPQINNGVIKANNVFIETQGQKVLKMDFYDRDFYVMWNEAKKLSWSGLNRCKEYLDYHHLDSDEITKQWHNYITRIVMLLGMVLCGVVFGFQNGISRVFVCAVISCWLIQVAMFMPLFEAIIAMWANALGWLLWGLWYFI